MLLREVFKQKDSWEWVTYEGDKTPSPIEYQEVNVAIF
jgi:UDP-3-O-[3-hydroxymyristoyl] N-acetylglucosamine deacetylase